MTTRDDTTPEGTDEADTDVDFVGDNTQFAPDGGDSDALPDWPSSRRRPARSIESWGGGGSGPGPAAPRREKRSVPPPPETGETRLVGTRRPPPPETGETRLFGTERPTPDPESR